jgi:hypothetical protein
MFVLVFLLYYEIYRESPSRLGGSLLMAWVSTFIPFVAIGLGAFFSQGTYLPSAERERVNGLLRSMDLEIVREKKGFVKYRIRDRKWPFNRLWVRQNDFNIYLVSNYFVIKQIENELQGKV